MWALWQWLIDSRLIIHRRTLILYRYLTGYQLFYSQHALVPVQHKIWKIYVTQFIFLWCNIILKCYSFCVYAYADSFTKFSWAVSSDFAVIVTSFYSCSIPFNLLIINISYSQQASNSLLPISNGGVNGPAPLPIEDWYINYNSMKEISLLFSRGWLISARQEKYLRHDLNKLRISGYQKWRNERGKLFPLKTPAKIKWG